MPATYMSMRESATTFALVATKGGDEPRDVDQMLSSFASGVALTKDRRCATVWREAHAVASLKAVSVVARCAWAKTTRVTRTIALVWDAMISTCAKARA